LTFTHQRRPDRAYKKTQIIEISNPIAIDTVVQLISHTSTVSPPCAGMAVSPNPMMDRGIPTSNVLLV